MPKIEAGEPLQKCGWCITARTEEKHLECVKNRPITGTCGCTSHPGVCGGDVA